MPTAERGLQGLSVAAVCSLVYCAVLLGSATAEAAACGIRCSSQFLSP